VLKNKKNYFISNDQNFYRTKIRYSIDALYNISIIRYFSISYYLRSK